MERARSGRSPDTRTQPQRPQTPAEFCARWSRRSERCLFSAISGRALVAPNRGLGRLARELAIDFLPSWPPPCGPRCIFFETHAASGFKWTRRCDALEPTWTPPDGAATWKSTARAWKARSGYLHGQAARPSPNDVAWLTLQHRGVSREVSPIITAGGGGGFAGKWIRSFSPRSGASARPGRRPQQHSCPAMKRRPTVPTFGGARKQKRRKGTRQRLSAQPWTK